MGPAGDRHAERGLPIIIGPDEAPKAAKTTPLDALHQALGARMVTFAGYSMPLQYRPGIVAEHRHCREHAALFDVSHMGQAMLHGAAAAAALEQLVPSDIMGLSPGRQRYTVLLNEAGGILDDVMVANLGQERLLLVVNASRKDADFAHLAANLGESRVEVLEGRALLALQGPSAAAVLGALAPQAGSLPFMGSAALGVAGIPCIVSRSGYTGEDGFEISLPGAQAEDLARRLLAATEVIPAGLGARDTLRLEAGFCLYGNDIDELTTPVEAGLAWTIGKRRRVAWDFPGAAAIRDQLENGPTRRRVGLRPEGRAPARSGIEIVAEDGTRAGTITSGGFSPTLSAPIAMAYVRADLAAETTPVLLLARNRQLPARVSKLPFVPHRYAS